MGKPFRDYLARDGLWIRCAMFLSHYLFFEYCFSLTVFRHGDG
jgi:hypothetical protein